MKPGMASLLMAGATLLAGCGQTDQQLPFGADDRAVTRPVTTTGATISSSAGASVQIPAGALASGTSVTLTPAPAPAQTQSGASAGTHVFHLEPAGATLAKAAATDLGIQKNNRDAWLASIVVSTPAGVIENGEASVDLASGIARGEIGTLGTLSAVIPERGAVIRARPLSQIPASPAQDNAAGRVANPTRALRVQCGEARNRCNDLMVGVSNNLLSTVDTAAVVFPQLRGEIRIEGARASGAITLVTPLRARLGSKTSAVTIPSEITAEATSATVVTETQGQVTFSNLRVRGKSGKETGETTVTLTVGYTGNRASIRLEHSLDATLTAGKRETVTVAGQIPLQRVQ